MSTITLGRVDMKLCTKFAPECLVAEALVFDHRSQIRKIFHKSYINSFERNEEVTFRSQGNEQNIQMRRIGHDSKI